MEKLLKEFNVPAKHGSEEELSLWRNHVTPVKNPRRRFRYVANLDKRSAVQEQKAKIGEKLQACFVLYMEELESTDAGDVLYEWAREAEETLQEDKEKEFLNEASAAGCGSE